MAIDEDFAQLIWAVDAIQSGRVDAASKYLRFPAEAATNEIGAANAIHNWELETLVGQRLVLPKSEEDRSRTLNCNEFGAAANLVNILRKLEDAESGIYLKRIGIFTELHRISHRQFPWQRGFFNVPQFYRSAFIYGHEKCRAYFETSYGLTFSDFALVGFGLFAAFTTLPAVPPNLSLDALGVSPSTFQTAVGRLSSNIEDARAQYAKMLEAADSEQLGVAYQPSFLRKYPVLEFGNGVRRLRSPLPQLVLLRITTGLYYDLVGGGQELLNEASDRFEQYCAEYIQAMLPAFKVARCYRYIVSQNNFETPDILVNSQGATIIVIECKATKLTFRAQFGDDPISESKRGFSEVAKAVFQLWRYFSHARRGLVPNAVVSPDAHGVVLTLDSWIMMSRGLTSEIMAAAHELADRDQNITATDRRAVVFCSVEELEGILARTDEAGFLRTLSSAVEKTFEGWLLSSVDRELASQAGVERASRRFPFDLENVLPWWSKTKMLRAQSGENVETGLPSE